MLRLESPFFDLLSEGYKKPDALGGCRRDRSIKKSARGKESYMDEAVRWFGSYKFVIAFENNWRKGYLTEKIINAVLANTVPIYFGAPDILDYVNPKRFIRCELDTQKLTEFGRMKFKDPSSREKWVKTNLNGLEECVQEVKRIDQDDDAYKAMISEPFFYGNTLEDSPFDYAYYGRRIRNILRLYDSDVLK
mmetsp:Transcript_27746/g.67488  ORF Transcript_27746/g.67488 Transcript_27746/m.67488 type:complete len:192 (-) Transcript_27746:159-734(-)